jgi:hypothetical protein
MTREELDRQNLTLLRQLTSLPSSMTDREAIVYIAGEIIRYQHAFDLLRTTSDKNYELVKLALIGKNEER